MNNIKGEIVVVSGLPRSGTSMMMQMLKEGGVDILTDEERKADNSNPKGYLEYEKVKGLAMDNSWVHEASGKAIKVIAQLINHLPDEYNYKIIFMERELDEVLVSQQKMLGKNPDPNTIPMGLYTAFQKQLDKMYAWVESQPTVELMKVKYTDVLEKPIEVAEEVASFIDMDLDGEAMASVVDKDLYRNRVKDFK